MSMPDQHTDIPRHGDEQRAEPQQAEPRNTEPRNTEPQYRDQLNPDPSRGESSVDSTRRAEPRHNGAHDDLQRHEGAGATGATATGSTATGSTATGSTATRTSDARTGTGPDPTASSTDADADGRERLVSAERAESYGSRWDAVKGTFVDEPRRAVAEADALVGELLDELEQLFRKQRSDIEHGLDADETSTEDMRLALRRYRSFFDRLLTL